MMMLISWATILTVYTILLQNSCTPLLEWTNTEARSCPQELANSSVERLNKSSVIRQQKTEKSSNGINSVKKQETSFPKGGKSEKKQKTSSSKVSNSVSNERTDSKDKRNDGNTSKEIIGVAAGSVAAIGLAVIEAPVVVVAGVGFAVWLAARTLFSLGK